MWIVLGWCFFNFYGGGWEGGGALDQTGLLKM